MMIQTERRRRIEVLADKPLIRSLAAAAAASGIENYTLLPVAGGVGTSGTWSDDQLTGATAKQMFLAICNEDVASAFVDKVTPLLDTHGLLLMLSNIDVVRAEKY